MILAERLRNVVETMTIPEVTDRSAITISVGVARTAPSDTDISKTINRADQALYQAKVEGRNRVISFQAS